MTTNSDTEKLIFEEQQILDNLIEEMLDIIGNLDEESSRFKGEWMQARESRNPDDYSKLLAALERLRIIDDKRSGAKRVMNELYHTRLQLKVQDDDGKTEDIEVKVGLHTYQKGPNIFVTSWKMPVCRHYMLDSASESYTGTVSDGRGFFHKTKFDLLLKRKIDTRFAKVTDVIHMFPLISEGEERKVFDKFLEDLLERRSTPDFKNIVFSIQKKQGEIIKTPFSQNLIVQGCAGSGKSMIMLHRLPILMYDNPDLERNNLYIITPSQTYIQMAEAMLEELEISDLSMGTLTQYYEYCIQKYGRKLSDLGKYNPSVRITAEAVEYVYSNKLLEDINNRIYEIFGDSNDLSREYELFGITRKNNSAGNTLYEARAKQLDIQAILSANNKNINEYYKAIKEVISGFSALDSIITNRKLSIIQAIQQKRTASESIITTQEKEIGELDPVKNKVAISNRQKIIEQEQKQIEEYNRLIETVESDSVYSAALLSISEKIGKLLSLFSNANQNREDLPNPVIYEYIRNISLLIGQYYGLSYEVAGIKDPYLNYVKPLNEILQREQDAMLHLQSLHMPILSEERLNELTEKTDQISRNIDSADEVIYRYILKIMEVPLSKKAIPFAIKESPYIYLRVLYALYGVPNAKKERLITVDEAQSLAPLEYELIRELNANNVVLNLFGDENQHIEDTKGINRWSDLGFGDEFARYDMTENYRNARQITEYCNKKFGMEMTAINFDGNGVHEIASEETFFEEMEKIFLTVQKSGLATIIVKDSLEASYLLEKFSQYSNKLNDMTGDNRSLHYTRWNIITVEDVKGLEFETVIAITGRMTRNEKYISYTRALDELYVYDVPVGLPLPNQEEPDLVEEASNSEIADVINNEGVHSIVEAVDQVVEIRPISAQVSEITETEHKAPLGLSGFIRKAINRINGSEAAPSEVRDFFKSKGLKVLDNRAQGGFLIVIGEQSDIKPIIDEAVDKFDIMGRYTSNHDTNYQNGWITKTNK